MSLVINILVKGNCKHLYNVTSLTEFSYLSKNRTTVESSFEIVYGTYPINVVNLISVLNAKQLGEKVMDLIARIRNIHELVQNQIEKTKAIYKQAADKHHCKIVFDEGELVWANLKKERFQAGSKGRLGSVKC